MLSHHLLSKNSKKRIFLWNSSESPHYSAKDTKKLSKEKIILDSQGTIFVIKFFVCWTFLLIFILSIFWVFFSAKYSVWGNMLGKKDSEFCCWNFQCGNFCSFLAGFLCECEKDGKSSFFVVIQIVVMFVESNWGVCGELDGGLIVNERGNLNLHFCLISVCFLPWKSGELKVRLCFIF